ncbi:MAG TPA: TMEM175 family protein [Candidatus Acidoferrum sp.]|nr:TMEM175 family protein [Candidatus Acidoferrum sp.]
MSSNATISETGRVEAFSDGVFAIAITLLVLEVKIPTLGAVPLGLQLARQWPQYVSFVVAFMFIGIMWINHHRMFTHIKRSDTVLMLLNLLLLLGVTALPFPTAVLAAHLGQVDQRTAILLFNGTCGFIAIAFNVLWRYGVSKRGHLLGAGVDLESAQKISRQYAFGPLLYIVCFALAYINVLASLALNAGLACFFALPPQVAVRHHREG